MGYYHGYKGHRFAGDSKNRLPIDSFNQVAALNAFDADLKSLFYPRLMQLETALKNYTVEAILANSSSERLDDIWPQCVTGHRGLTGKGYRDAWERRQRLRRELDDLVYSNRSKDVNPALLEQRPRRPHTGALRGHDPGALRQPLRVPVPGCQEGGGGRPVDALEHRLPHALMAMAFAHKDLRNAVAHNGVVFDVRFRSGGVSKEVSALLEGQIGVPSVSFSSITDYVLLVAYLMKGIRCPATERRRFVSAYVDVVERFRREVPYAIFSQIIPTDFRPKTKAALRYVKAV